MDSKLLALINALIEKRIEDIPIESRRGLRGPKGIDGESFDFENHRLDILEIISNEIKEIQEELKLKFSDLTEDEKESLKLKFENLTDEERLGLKGARGQRGRGFKFDEHKDDIFKEIADIFDSERDSLKLKFSDLTDEDLEQLRIVGPRGLSGRDFIFSEHEERILDILNETVNNQKESLKLKFSDLTEEEKNDLKIKGPRGQRGKGFNIDEHREEITSVLDSFFNEAKESFKLRFTDLSDEEVNSLKLKFSDLTEEEIDSLKVKGPRGYRGSRGPKAKDAPIFLCNKGEPCVDGEEEQLYLDSTSGNLYKWGTGWELQGNLQGPQGLSIRGLPGVAGVSGKNAIDGRDGRDAPFITNIEIEEKEDSFYLVFYFSDGSKIETNDISIPSIKETVSNYFVSGGGSYPSGVVDKATKLVLEKIASEDIDSGELVRLDSSTTASLATIDTYGNSKVVGIALETITTGNVIRILVSGIHEDAGYSFPVNEPLYLQSDSSIGLNAPTAPGQFVVRIGESLGTGAIYLRVEESMEIV